MDKTKVKKGTETIKCGVCLGTAALLAKTAQGDRLYWCLVCGSIGQAVGKTLPGWTSPSGIERQA